MRFYAVSTEAVELTFRALQKLDRDRKGSHRPSRALRVATLFGHLQCRARGGTNVQVGCRQLERWPGICIRVKSEPISRIWKPSAG